MSVFIYCKSTSQLSVKALEIRHTNKSSELISHKSLLETTTTKSLAFNTQHGKKYAKSKVIIFFSWDLLKKNTQNKKQQ